MLAALVVTAAIGIKLAWDNVGELKSIYAQTFLDRTSDRLTDHPRENSIIAFESRTRTATGRAVTPTVDELRDLELPIVDDAGSERSLDEEQSANVDVPKSESSHVDAAPSEGNVEMVIARTQDVIDASSENVPESEVTESTIDSSTTTRVEMPTPAETTLGSYNASPRDGLNFTETDLTETDLAGQATCADQQGKFATCGPSRKFGTAIEWAEDAEQAGQLAKEHDKLVFLIQVSGNFAREEFT